MNKLSLWLGVLFASANVVAAPELPLEQLLGVNVREDGITFQVRSNGCTEKQHFQFQVEERLEPISSMLPAMEHHHYITVNRQIPDGCEMFVPFGTEIFMSFEELNIFFGKFHVSNPIGGDMAIAP